MSVTTCDTLILRGRVLIPLLLLAVAVASPTQAAGRKDPGVITLATDVRKGPGPRDPVLATVPAGHRVTVLEMAGASARIKSNKVTGWVPAAKVRIGDGGSGQASSAGGGGFFRSMTSLLGGGKKTKDIKVTAGARGLTPGALAGANPNPAARTRMENQRVSRADAEKFARRGRLVARNYSYLGAGAGSGTASTGSGGGLLQGLQGLTSGGGTVPATVSPDR